MLKNSLVLTAICILSFSVSAQRQTQQPLRGHNMLPSQQEQEDFNRRYARQIAEFNRIQGNGPQTAMPKSIFDRIERDKKGMIKELMQPTTTERTSYPQLFKQADTGFFSFLSVMSCKKKIKDKSIILFYHTDCLEQILPGRGTQFSFRKESYDYSGYSDLSLSDDLFHSDGIATQTVLTDLGDVPLIDVKLDDSAYAYLVNFIPASSMEDFIKKETELKTGVTLNDQKFANTVKAIPGHTYLLRSIAYGGKLFAVYNLGDSKLRFDLLENDNRGDVIVVFRYLEKALDGDARVLWRKLRQSSAPVLNFPEINNPNVVVPVTIVTRVN